MICTNCGKDVPDSSNVCGYCGHRLKAAPGEATTTMEMTVPAAAGPAAAHPAAAMPAPGAAPGHGERAELGGEPRPLAVLTVTAAIALTVTAFLPWVGVGGMRSAFGMSYQFFRGGRDLVQVERYPVLSLGFALLLAGLVAVFLAVARRGAWVVRVLGGLSVVLGVLSLWVVYDAVGSGVRAFWGATGVGPLLAIAAGALLVAAPRR